MVLVCGRAGISCGSDLNRAFAVLLWNGRCADFLTIAIKLKHVERGAAKVVRWRRFGDLIMWPFNRSKVTDRLNTVDLDDDLGDVEMLIEVEQLFKLKIEDSEAQTLVTVGDLYELVKRKIPRDGSVDPVWELVEYIVRNHSNSNSAIDADTTFFPKYANPRQPVENN